LTEPTYKRVCRVIGELTGIDPPGIGPGQNLGYEHRPNFYWQSLVINAEPPKPLELDSFDRIQLAMQLEEEFDILISDDEVDDLAIDHVGGLVAFVQGKLDAKPKTYGEAQHLINAAMRNHMDAMRQQPRISDAAEPAEPFGTSLVASIFDKLDKVREEIERVTGISQFDLKRPGAEL
jgi:acyl carrier protein